MRLLIALALVVLLAGCGRKHVVKQDLPDSTPVAPTIVYVDRVRYVPVPKRLVEELPIAEGPLSQCPDVAAARKKAQKVANSRLREIGLIQGTDVPKAADK
jgi:predicted small lipoprotein YifL